MARLSVVIASTRPRRIGHHVADWVLARVPDDFDVTVHDLREINLPFLDEPGQPADGDYTHDHTWRWSAAMRATDALLIVMPEYNRGYNAALKNAIDYLYAEWNNKAVGFVSYGAVGGARAAEHLRLVAAELQMADVRQQVALSLLTEFENFSVFKPGDYNVDALNVLLDQVIAWSGALSPLRAVPQFA
jgi:NAD(P)H-dependent FMN reductase